MYASTLMDAVARDLLDEASDDSDRRWPQEDLLEYLNAGQRQLVFLLPTAYVIVGVYQLVAGTKQSLPDGTSSFQNPAAATIDQAIELISVNRNMGSSGTSAGNAIIPIKREVMDRMDFSWHTATADDEVQHSIFDPKDRTKFSVYPPQPTSGMGWIEATFSAVPPEVVAGAGPDYDVDISLRDDYAEPLKHYMKFAAYSKDAQTSQFAAARALAEWNLFVTLIGRKDLIERNYKAVQERAPYGNSDIPIS